MGDGTSGIEPPKTAASDAPSAPSVTELCALPLNPGFCDASERRFGFDAALGSCRAFDDSGCGGNENNFETEAECYATCGGVGSDQAAACTESAQCITLQRTCCGACGLALPHPVVAINRDRALDVIARTGCLSVSCPACDPAAQVDESWLYTEAGWFTSECREGFCLLVDIREARETACTRDEDCVLRDGFSCLWPRNDVHTLVSVNTASTLDARCDRELFPLTAASLPPTAHPSCSERGRCTVAFQGPALP